VIQKYEPYLHEAALAFGILVALLINSCTQTTILIEIRDRLPKQEQAK
jgi:hypothetical protein